MRMSGPRRAILRALADRPGAIVDSSGFATAELLRDPTVETFPAQSVRRALTDLEAAGLVDREINGRRVYRISLTEQGRAFADRQERPHEPPSSGITIDQAVASGDRRQILDAVAAVSTRLKQWAASADLTKSPERLRLELFHATSDARSDPPAPEELALAVVHAAALSDALLASYRTAGTEVDPLLVDSAISTVLDLSTRLAALATAVRSDTAA